jgi:excisionase family DNA binding protein
MLSTSSVVWWAVNATQVAPFTNMAGKKGAIGGKRRMDIEQAQPVQHDELLTLEETAALLKVPKSWIYERTRKGTIPHLKLGKYLRFPLADLLLWITTHGRQGRETSRASGNDTDQTVKRPKAPRRHNVTAITRATRSSSQRIRA